MIPGSAVYIWSVIKFVHWSLRIKAGEVLSVQQPMWMQREMRTFIGWPMEIQKSIRKRIRLQGGITKMEERE